MVVENIGLETLLGPLHENLLGSVVTSTCLCSCIYVHLGLVFFPFRVRPLYVVLFPSLALHAPLTEEPTIELHKEVVPPSGDDTGIWIETLWVRLPSLATAVSNPPPHPTPHPPTPTPTARFCLKVENSRSSSWAEIKT